MQHCLLSIKTCFETNELCLDFQKDGTLCCQTTNHIICSERGIIFDNVRLEPIKLFGEAHWLEVSIFSSDVKFQKCALVASIACLSKEPRMVRAFGPL